MLPYTDSSFDVLLVTYSNRFAADDSLFLPIVVKGKERKGEKERAREAFDVMESCERGPSYQVTKRNLVLYVRALHVDKICECTII